jgi:hypothetical protein
MSQIPQLTEAQFTALRGISFADPGKFAKTRTGAFAYSNVTLRKATIQTLLRLSFAEAKRAGKRTVLYITDAGKTTLKALFAAQA